MQYFQRFWRDVKQGKNLDLGVTVAAALGVTLCSLLGVFWRNLTNTLVLAVLALVAVGALVTRYQLEDATRGLRAARLPDFVEEFPESYRHDLESHGELWLVGVSLWTQFRDHVHLFEERLARGDSIRVLVIDPDSHAAELAEDRVGIAPDDARRRAQIQQTLNQSARLAREYPGKVQARVTSEELSFGATVARAYTKGACMYLQYYAYKIRSDENLKLTLFASDGKWFDYHLGQLEKLWENASPPKFTSNAG